MPWDCKSCNNTVGEDTETKCPSCGTDKAAWTMVAGVTRAFAVTRKIKVQCRRGIGAEPLAAGSDWKAIETEPTEEARSVTKEAAIRLAANDELPPPDQVLVVRLFPKAGSAVSVGLSPEFEANAVEEVTFEEEAPELDELGAFDARFLFVHGPDPLPEDLEFPGLHLVEVSDETARGFAPSVLVKALRKRESLPIKLGLRLFTWSA